MGETYSFAHAASLAVMLMNVDSLIAYRVTEQEDAAIKGEPMSIEDFKRKRQEILGGGNGC